MPDSLKAVILRRLLFARRISRNASDLITPSRHFGQRFWVKSREKAIRPKTLREILRQKKAQDDSASKVLLAPGAKRAQRENHTRN